MNSLGVLAAGEIGPAKWMITSRWGGVSQDPYSEANFAIHVGDDPTLVQVNRKKLSSEINKSVIYPVACHSNLSSWIKGNEVIDVPNVDGLITSNRDLGLATLSADCATVLLYAEKINSIASLHAGWRGMKDQILPNAIYELRKAGADKISAVLGPAICADCYQVGKERFLEVEKFQPEAAVINKNQEFAVDVKAGLMSQLQKAEVTFESIDICSFESADLYSYRRDKVTGRNASVIWIES